MAPKLEKRPRTSRWRDRTGERQNRLTITGWAGFGPGKRSWWHGVCSCGTQVTLRMEAHEKSCGCLKREMLKAAVSFRNVHEKSKITLADGRRVTAAQAGRILGVKAATVRSRVDRGWPPEKLGWTPRSRRRPGQIMIKPERYRRRHARTEG